MKPTISKLKNGIPVILCPLPHAQSLTVFVFCHVGSRYESESINGASHFIEHLMFKGTKRRPNTQVLSKELDQYGANFNAMTSKDFTGYYIKIDATHAALAVDLLHDMLFHSKFDAKEIERERGVIIEEINMYEDNPSAHIEDLLEATLFPNSTLGWSIAGPREVIRKVSREDLVNYRDAFYIPSRLTIAVAGAVPGKGFMQLLDRTFGSVKQPVTPKDHDFACFCAPKRLKKPLAFQEKKIEQAQVGLAFHGYAIDHKDEPAAKLLSMILGGTMSSRLFIQVRERKGLCYSIYSYHQSLEDTGLFGIYAGLDRKRLKEAVKTIFDEINKVLKHGVTADELRRAKDHARGKLTLAFEDSSFQSDWYGKQWLFSKKLVTPEARLNQFRAVTTADIKRVAKSIFRKEALARAAIGPELTEQALEKIFKWE